MLERHRDQAGKIGSAPRPIELEPWLPRRAREPRGPLLGRLGARVGREPERWIEGEVPLLVHGGIATAGVGIVAERSQHRPGEEDLQSPPGGEQLALYLDALNPICILQ